MPKILVLLALPASLAVAACDGLGQAMTSHTDVVARAAGHELTVDEVAGLLAPQPRIPAQAEVVSAVANLWVDYILLATVAAGDTALANLDLDPLLRPVFDQEVVWQLREQVIQVDSVIPEEELRAAYEEQQPGVRVRARHILLRIPPDGGAQARDSVMALIQSLRERANAGEDFAALAREYSQDGSAQQGGDLGFGGRGSWVAPFEEAAFALQPGQVSDVVETPFGLHIIKVEEREVPPFEDVRMQFHANLVNERVAEQEERYITELTEPMNVRVEEGAVENARELARSPGSSLRGRAASRPLVSYQGGALTAEEFQGALRSWQPGQLGQLAAASDEQVEQVLEGFTRNEILVGEAHRRELTVSDAEQDSVRDNARGALRQQLRASGLLEIQQQDGESREEAIERAVMMSLAQILSNQQSVINVGPISYYLRAEHDGEVFDRALDAAVQRITALRPQQPAEGAAPQPQPQPQQPPADTGQGS